MLKVLIKKKHALMHDCKQANFPLGWFQIADHVCLMKNRETVNRRGMELGMELNMELGKELGMELGMAIWNWIRAHQAQPNSTGAP